MIDRTTKALLFALTLGLWANVLTQWVPSTVVQAQDFDDTRIVRELRDINSSTSNLAGYLSQIASNTRR
jgi:hypothetical protein